MSIETPDYSILPEHMRSGAKLWIENGIATGSFLVSVLENDLKGAMITADSINLYDCHPKHYKHGVERRKKK